MTKLTGFDTSQHSKGDAGAKKGDAGAKETGGAGGFGVKSYLHQFYESAAAAPGAAAADEFWYLLPPSRRQNRWALHACRGCTVLALLLLLVGAAAIILGYTFPPHPVDLEPFRLHITKVGENGWIKVDTDQSVKYRRTSLAKINRGCEAKDS